MAMITVHVLLMCALTRIRIRLIPLLPVLLGTMVAAAAANSINQNSTVDDVEPLTTSTPPSSSSSSSSSSTSAMGEVTTTTTTNGTHIAFDMRSVCEQSVQAITELQKDLGFPEYYLPDFAAEVILPPPKREGDFDVAAYLDVLEHISLPDGKTLDWIYDLNWMLGEPVIYVRDKDAEPFATIQEYRNASCSNDFECPNYLDEIIPLEESPEGYMQKAVLHVMAEQFYLYWHALMNEFRIVANQEMVLDVLTDIDNECGNAPTGNDLELLLNIDMTPMVKYSMTNDDSSVQATLVVFNKWGGFYRKNILFTLDGMAHVDHENLFAYRACYIF